MKFLFSNYATGSLALPIDSVQTSITLVGGHGATFPSPGANEVFRLVLEDVDGNYEICTCTARVGDILTVTRGQEGTSAQAFGAGAVAELRMTAGVMQALLQQGYAVMSGQLDMNTNEIINAVLVSPLIQGGILLGVTLRATDAGVDNEIFIPDGGNPPTIGGHAIWHAGLANTILEIGGRAVADLVDKNREVGTSATSGLDGGGDLSINRALRTDNSRLTELATPPEYNDKLSVYDASVEDQRGVAAEMVYGIGVRELAGHHTLERADAGVMLEFNSVDNWNLSVPSHAAVPFPHGVVIPVRRRGVGTVTIVEDGGVTVESPSDHRKIGAQYGLVVLIKRGDNLWALEGRLAA